MQYEKYRYKFFEKIGEKLNIWFNNQTSITNEDLHHFVHSVNGTAKMLQMMELQQITENIIENVRGMNKKNWSKEELFTLLRDLARMCHFSDQSDQTRQRENGTPLLQVIDHDKPTLLLLKESLEKKGWLAIINSEPEIAVSQYFDMKPDCVIIDVDFAYKNGFHLHEDIQKHNNKFFIPKMAISDKNDRQTRINAYKNGADDFMEKPIDVEEFIVRLERLLHRKQIYDQCILPEKSNIVLQNKLYVTVIDNDAIIRSMLMKIFTSMTFDNLELDIQVFEDGISFFNSQRLEELGGHLLIFEGAMPIMSGIEILQKVNKHRNKKHIRIFMLAGNKGENEIARALKLGADDYMTKPFSITELKARIERLIKRMM